MKKILLIVILCIPIIFFFLRYLWYSELERISYENKKHESFSSDLFLSHMWSANGHHFKLWVPYKKDIYASPYTYTIIFSLKNDDVDHITFNEISILFSDKQVNILNDDATDIVVKNGRIYTKEEIKNFREIKKIIIANENVGKLYYVSFNNVEIPYRNIKKFNTALSITIHYKSGNVFSKKIITEFEQTVEKMLTFPTT